MLIPCELVRINRNKVKNFGYVSRMDNLQAGILNFRLKYLNKIIIKNIENDNIYFKHLNKKKIFIPEESKKEFNTYHTFVIQVKKRNEVCFRKCDTVVNLFF